MELKFVVLENCGQCEKVAVKRRYLKNLLLRDEGVIVFIVD